MSAHINVGGAWKTTQSVWVKVSGVWKQSSLYTKDGGVWKSIHQLGNAPAGLVIFWESSTPSGWSVQTGMLNRHLMLGSTYGTTGGSGSHSHSDASTGDCSDNVSTWTNFHRIHSYGNDYIYQDTYIRGHGHSGASHSCGSASNTPLSHTLIPIVANVQTFLPQGSILLMDSTNIPDGWERYNIQNKYILCSSLANQSMGSQTSDHSDNGQSSNSTGSFQAMMQMSGGYDCKGRPSSHSHSLSHSHTNVNLPYYKNYLAIKSTSIQYDAPPNSIGIFTGDIPTGWSLISGSGYLIRLSDTGSVGSTGGQNSSHDHSHSSFSSESVDISTHYTSHPRTLNSPSECCHFYADEWLNNYACGLNDGQCPCQEGYQGGIQGQLINHTSSGVHSHSVSGGGAHSSNSNMPLYITVKLAKKQ